MHGTGCLLGIKLVESAVRMRGNSRGGCPLLHFARWAVILVTIMGGSQASRAEPYSTATVPLRVADHGVLLREGRPYRAVGINYFDGFYRAILDGADQSYVQGLARLAEYEIPFVRFTAGAFWPVEWDLYRTDPDEYFRRFDAFVAAAEQAGIGLIPSLFWTYFTMPDIVGEPVSRIGDPASSTLALMRRYIEEVVTRYRSSPAIWMWELGNEYSLEIDLPNAADHRPPTWTELGCPATRGPEDDLTHEMLVSLCIEFATQVRRHDPLRPITAGHAIPRPSQWHQRMELSWQADTRAQYRQTLIDLSPAPMDTISIHYYPAGEGPRFGEPGPVDFGEILAQTDAAATTAGQAVFIGEFGVAADQFAGDPAAIREAFEAVLAAFDAGEAALAAAWVYDFAAQDARWNITPDNDRAWMLDAVREANRRLRTRAGARTGHLFGGEPH